MTEGVSIMSPEQTYIDPRAKIGTDTVIHPFTAILGPAVIGIGCRFGHKAVVSAGGGELAVGTHVKPFQHFGK
jgi:bifunctional UDP-N-acetylglucosamine pyrophosphorylase/glucosamine-1-phosphate N-acetyltransferase